MQPIAPGLADLINEQEGLYTLYLRGTENGQNVDRKRVISSVSRCLNPYEKAGFDAMMGVAVSDDLEYVVSNTTEAGIVYDPVCQQVDDELIACRSLLEQCAAFAGQFRREEIPASELVAGMKCGGLDGLSGITANPTVGRFSDLLVAQGGSGRAVFMLAKWSLTFGGFCATM